jgi:hypothetical protein
MHIGARLAGKPLPRPGRSVSQTGHRVDANRLNRRRDCASGMNISGRTLVSVHPDARRQKRPRPSRRTGRSNHRDSAPDRLFARPPSPCSRLVDDRDAFASNVVTRVEATSRHEKEVRCSRVQSSGRRRRRCGACRRAGPFVPLSRVLVGRRSAIRSRSALALDQAKNMKLAAPPTQAP